MAKLYLVWNAAMNECVGFLDKYDANWTARGGRPPFGTTPTIGEAFRDSYGDDAERLPQTEVELEPSPPSLQDRKEMEPATIYRRKNGDFGSSCDGIQDTGHHIVTRNRRFSVWSVHDFSRQICKNATRDEAERAIAADWRVGGEAI